MSPTLSRVLLFTGCALSFLLSTGCQQDAEGEVPADGPAETEVVAPVAPETLGRASGAAVDDSTDAAAEDGPGLGGGYGD